MEQIRYRIELEGGETVSGSIPMRPGKLVLAPQLPEGILKSVTAVLHVNMEERDKVFMNGYQAWTYCPEYGREDYTRGIGPLPRRILDHYGVERYGDYFFVDYPRKRGVTHGESYCYFRRGQHYRLFASLDEHPGYTLFRYDSGSRTLTVQRDCAGLRCGGSFHALDLFYAEGTEDQVFDAWFAAMDLRCRTQEKIAGYSSWYNRYQNISETSIFADLAGCVGQMRPGDVFQIDDGWESAVGDWLEADGKKFPKGMAAAAAAIHEKGFRAGLWLAPFVCQKGSDVYRRHPDWLLQVDGKPWYCGSNWGGFYALDLDHPQVRDYLKQVFDRVLNQWDYDLVKLDFLYAAAPCGSETESRAGKMIRAMELLRGLCGDKLILGCGVPLMPAFGLVDYCRVGCDVSLDWDNNLLMRHTNRERPSTRQAIGNSIFRRQLNGRAFLNDPDVFFLRESNLRLSLEQKHVLATVNSLLGGVLFHSDNMAEYDSAARAKYAQLLRNRDAAKIRVHGENGLAVTYEIDGHKHAVTVE